MNVFRTEKEDLLNSIKNTLSFYKGSLDDLSRIVRGLIPPAKLRERVGGVYHWGYELERLLQVGRDGAYLSREELDELRILEQAAGLADEHRDLWSLLGAETVRGLLLDRLEEETDRYVAIVQDLCVQYAEQDPDNEDELFDVEDISNVGPLITRDSIEILLGELEQEPAAASLKARIAEVDERLRWWGKDLLAPFVVHGTFDTFRRSTFPPREWWWYYLDQPADAGGTAE